MRGSCFSSRHARFLLARTSAGFKGTNRCHERREWVQLLVATRRPNTLLAERKREQGFGKVRSGELSRACHLFTLADTLSQRTPFASPTLAAAPHAYTTVPAPPQGRQTLTRRVTTTTTATPSQSARIGRPWPMPQCGGPCGILWTTSTSRRSCATQLQHCKVHLPSCELPGLGSCSYSCSACCLPEARKVVPKCWARPQRSSKLLQSARRVSRPANDTPVLPPDDVAERACWAGVACL